MNTTIKCCKTDCCWPCSLCTPLKPSSLPPEGQLPFGHSPLSTSHARWRSCLTLLWLAAAATNVHDPMLPAPAIRQLQHCKAVGFVACVSRQDKRAAKWGDHRSGTDMAVSRWHSCVVSRRAFEDNERQPGLLQGFCRRLAYILLSCTCPDRCACPGTHTSCIEADCGVQARHAELAGVALPPTVAAGRGLPCVSNSWDIAQ